MAAGLSTPFLDLFRRGEVARDVRMLAAQGAIAPRPLEQLGILSILSADPDPDVRQTAEATLARLPADVLGTFLARSDVPTELRQFFVKRGVPIAAAPAGETDDPLVDEDDTEYGPEPTTEEEKKNLMQQIAAMTVPEKVRAAMKGSREMRAVLVRDSNKLVALSVLSSPKLTEMEVEAIARMGSVSEDVLRSIATTRAWVKSYNIMMALVKNAKTPVGMTLNMLGRLNEKDLRSVSIDRNIPEPLRISARRKLVIDD